MKKDVPRTALELFPNGPGSDAFQLGRRLVLEFSGDQSPTLCKIQYFARRGEDPTFWEINHPTNGFSWTDVPQALSLLFVDYLIWDKTGRAGVFDFVGSCTSSPAASLGDAIYGKGPIQELFAGTERPGEPIKPHAKRIFVNGDNIHGRATIERDRKISVSQNFLPPDCVAIVWDFHSKTQPLEQLADLQLLSHRLRQSLDLIPPLPPPASKQAPEPESHPNPTAQPASPDHHGHVSSRPVEAVKLYNLEDFPEIDRYREGIINLMLVGYKPEDVFRNLLFYRRAETTLERVKDYCNTIFRIYFPADGRVLPLLLEIDPTDYEWPDNLPIWSIGGETWTLNDVTQGTLILGATGSGKTSCSGRTIAHAFLAKKFGGLILTTKPGEAKEWITFCNGMDREADVRWVRDDGPLRLNLLAYETQRQGAGSQLTENLIGFFRVLISVLGSRHGQHTNEGFWQNAGNQLLRNLLDVFLVAQAPLSLDRFAEFVAAAPAKELADEEAWRDIPLFGEILTAAENNGTKPGDRRIVDKAKTYWLVDYPRLAPETRSCITFGFNAMLDTLRSRHIYELLCGETTVTPETILNGGIVIIDLPVKEFGDAGVLVQCAFKYLFQRAVERRQWLGDQTRPCFMFIDEAQNFFTEYDTVFQQTARSSRVATVLLSQNVNNFYAHLGGDQNARYLFDSLAGNLNTRIFHANGDNLTNEWASKMFGTWDRPVHSASTTPRHALTLNPFEDVTPDVGHGVSTRREPLVPPEDFAKLQSSNARNEYLSEAFVYRVGSLFAETELPFVRTAFHQIRIVEVQPQRPQQPPPLPKTANRQTKGT